MENKYAGLCVSKILVTLAVWVFSYFHFLAIARCAAQAAVLSDGNLIESGDFETGKVAGWANCMPGGKARIDDTLPHSGKWCLTYECAKGGKGGWLVRAFPVEAAHVYTVSGYTRGDAGSLGAALFFYDVNGKYIGETQVFSSASIPGWTQFEKAVKTPDMAVGAKLGLHVAEGVGSFDDLSVVPGDCVKTVVNEFHNSSFAYSLHESGLPAYWNSGGPFSFVTFRPGVHEGKFFRLATEEKSPVPGTKVLFVDQVGFTELKTGPLAGEKDYVFSVYMRSDMEDAKVSLGFIGGSGKKATPNNRDFVLKRGWQRLVLPFRLNAGADNFYATIKYNKNPIYMAAPMLHAGSEPVEWRPHPGDAMLPDLRLGRIGGEYAADDKPRELTVAEAEEYGAAAAIDEFRPLGGGAAVRGKYRAWFKQNGGTLFCKVECDSGVKPAVPRKEHMPLLKGNDAVELFISPSAKGAPFVQFMGGRNGDSAATLGSQGHAVNEGWSYNVEETAKGWRCEYRIPLSFFNEPGGRVWRLNLGITDFDGLKARYFSATAGGFQETQHFFEVKGLPRGAEAAPPPRIAAERDLYVAGEVVVRLRTFDVLGPATLRMMDETGKVILQSSETPSSESNATEFKIANLPNGYYRIVVEAANGKCETHFRKNVAAKSYSRVNRFTKNIEVDGNPFFPIVYNWSARKDYMPTGWHIMELKKRHFNTVIFSSEIFAPWYGYAPEDRRRLFGIFAAAGFKLILWTNADFKRSGTFAVAEAHRKCREELGEELLQHVIGWYYLDEIAPHSASQGIREEDIAPGYRADKAVDPDRLHFINWNWTNVTEGQKFYAEDGATDIYSLDCYPYNNSGAINFRSLSVFERAASAIGSRIDDASLPGIMWLQTYSFHEGTREPMPVEYRNNVFMGLVNNVSGYMSFSACPENGDLWDEMGRSYGAALKWLEMTVNPGSRRIEKGRKESVSYALWKTAGGGRAIVAANDSYAPQKIKVASGGQLDSGSLQLVGGEGTLAVGDDGTLEVSLPIAGSAAWFVSTQDARGER